MQRIFPFVVGFCLVSVLSSPAQNRKLYQTSGGEFIFSLANAEFANHQRVPVNLRFTMFLHLSDYWNYDLNDHLGLFTGLSLRNIGMITKEDYTYRDKLYTDVKTKRRSYAAGIPFAVKIGVFSKNFYLFAGGQYEWLFHYKEKHFVNNLKIKSTEWFSNKTNTFVPSVFGGIQFPGGINLRFTQMLDDFLNPHEFSEFSKTRLYYFSLSFHFRNKARHREKDDEPKEYVYSL